MVCTHILSKLFLWTINIQLRISPTFQTQTQRWPRQQHQNDKTIGKKIIIFICLMSKPYEMETHNANDMIGRNSSEKKMYMKYHGSVG